MVITFPVIVSVTVNEDILQDPYYGVNQVYGEAYCEITQETLEGDDGAIIYGE